MNQAELTQAQRHDAYKVVRDQITEHDSLIDSHYICFQLQEIVGCDRSNKVFLFFPELKLFEPEEGTDKIWSFEDTGIDPDTFTFSNEHRLFVAQLLIEMTRP